MAEPKHFVKLRRYDLKRPVTVTIKGSTMTQPTDTTHHEQCPWHKVDLAHARSVCGCPPGWPKVEPIDTTALRALVNAQAEDAGLWFVAQTAPEAYLQQELRRLHAAVEALAAPPPPVPDKPLPTIEDMSGCIDDPTGGMGIGPYLDALRGSAAAAPDHEALVTRLAAAHKRWAYMNGRFGPDGEHILAITDAIEALRPSPETPSHG